MESFSVISSQVFTDSSLWSMRLKINPNASMIAVTDSPNVKVLSLPDLDEIVTFTHPRSDDFAWSPDGSHIAIGNRDGTLKIYDIDNFSNITTVENCSDYTWADAMDWSSDGTMLAANAFFDSNTIRVWDTNAWKEIVTLDVGELGVNHIAFSPNNQYLVAGGYDDQLIICNTSDWSSKRFGDQDSYVGASLSFSEDSSMILADDVIYFVDDLSQPTTIPSMVHGYFSQANAEVATVDFNGVVYKWNSSDWSDIHERGEELTFDSGLLGTAIMETLILIHSFSFPDKHCYPYIVLLFL